tara:strand:+ start:3040 stop:3471 length:432 start_codon:yes stop_codon:yes gene_type:complete
MGLNPNVWLPKLKFTLQTIAITYPEHPNDVSTKKYYDFIQNLPVFIPMSPFGKEFIDMLDKYPVTPYLSSRLSFMKWIHFIFNKINEKLEKPQEDFYDSLEKYYNEYKPKEFQNKEFAKTRKKYIDFGICVLVIFGIMYFYKK